MFVLINVNCLYTVDTAHYGHFLVKIIFGNQMLINAKFSHTLDTTHCEHILIKVILWNYLMVHMERMLNVIFETHPCVTLQSSDSCYQIYMLSITFLSRGVCSVSMKTKSKTFAKWFPPQTAQKGDGDWKHGQFDDDESIVWDFDHVIAFSEKQLGV